MDGRSLAYIWFEYIWFEYIIIESLMCSMDRVYILHNEVKVDIFTFIPKRVMDTSRYSLFISNAWVEYFDTGLWEVRTNRYFPACVEQGRDYNLIDTTPLSSLI